MTIQDKSKTRNHIPWPNSLNTGRGNTPLEEPVPKFASRKGDGVILPPVDNNAAIILGRDRNPFGPPRSRVPHGSEEDPNNPKSARSEVSGFSDHMGAGAIDIVVGRGAPFALQKLQHDIFPQGLPPLYLSRSPDELGAAKLTAGRHPGKIMDAARIYMSQMCQIDDYFKINKINIPEDKLPCSAIMLKADKLRLHSRRDIYIIAGGDHETKSDSNGHTITESGKIHLVSKNNSDPSVKETSPAVRFTELKMCLLDMNKNIQDLLEVMNNFIFWQMKVNAACANSIYGTAVGMTTSNPITQAVEKITSIANTKDLFQIHAMKTYNVPKIETNYLLRGSPHPIASKTVTLN